jgi:hypothetical protein
LRDRRCAQQWWPFGGGFKGCLPLGRDSMLQVMAEWLRTAGAGLGRCPFCAQKAFFAMVTAWVANTLIVHLIQSPALPIATRLVALGMTLLWASHLLAYAGRVSANRSDSDAQRLTSRRSVLPLFAKTVVAATIISTIPRLALASTCYKKVGSACVQSHTGSLDPTCTDDCAVG